MNKKIFNEHSNMKVLDLITHDKPEINMRKLLG